MSEGRDQVLLLLEIKRRIEQLPKLVQEELGFAGEPEEEIARLYERAGDQQSAGDWWVRSVLTAERYGQVVMAHEKLKIAEERCPGHLGIRRELKRISAVLAKAEGMDK